MNKKVNKLKKKLKPSTIKKYVEENIKLNSCMKIVLGSSIKRIQQLSKSITNKDIKLKQYQDDLKQFKDVVLWYHKNLNEGNNGKEEAFQHVLQMPYSNEMNRLEFLQKEFDKIDYHTKIKINQIPEHIKTQKFNGDRNCSYLTMSPTLSPLKLRPTHSVLDKTSSCQSPGSTSLNRSTCSSNAWNCARFNEWHKFDPKPIKNKICNQCFKMESSISKIYGKHLFRCMRCGMYIHESCRESDNAKLCISLSKTGQRLTGQRVLDLKELCKNDVQPMVPNILLALMHHIQTFGNKTVMGRDNNVKGLCDKLFDGKVKDLSHYDVETAGNCLRFILRSLKAPLLPDKVLLQLINCIDEEKIHFENIFADCLREMTLDNQDTLTFLIIHMKIMAMTDLCKLDTYGMAALFMSSLVGETMNLHYDKQAVKVIKMLLEIDFDFYDSFLTENVFFENFFNSNRLSNSVLSSA